MELTSVVQQCLHKDIEERRKAHRLLQLSPTQTTYAQEIRAALAEHFDDANENDVFKISELLYSLKFVSCQSEAVANKAVARAWIDKGKWVQTVALAIQSIVNTVRPEDLDWLKERRKSIDKGMELNVSEEFPDPDCCIPIYFDYVILKIRSTYHMFER